MTTLQEAYESGQIAGWNHAAGQGGCPKPIVGKTKRSQAFADGWQCGYDDARLLIDSAERAKQMTLNRWA